MFFEEHANDLKKVMRLRELAGVLDWENLTASRHSPGVVNSDESVLRLAFHPIHFDSESQSLKPSAVSDVKDKGLSVDRLRYASREGCIETGRLRAARATEAGRQPRGVHAVSTLRVKDVRSVVTQGERSFAVYDTALEDNRAHADVCQLAPEGQAGRSARSRLWELCNTSLEIVPVSPPS